MYTALFTAGQSSTFVRLLRKVNGLKSMKTLNKKEVLEAIANAQNTTDETRVVVRTLSGDVSIINVKVSPDNSKIILTTRW
jgi:hypothetical protein